MKGKKKTFFSFFIKVILALKFNLPKGAFTKKCWGGTDEKVGGPPKNSGLKGG